MRWQVLLQVHWVIGIAVFGIAVALSLGIYIARKHYQTQRVDCEIKAKKLEWISNNKFKQKTYSNLVMTRKNIKVDDKTGIRVNRRQSEPVVALSKLSLLSRKLPETKRQNDLSLRPRLR